MKRISPTKTHKRSSVRYFSGFSLVGESELFSDYIDDGDFTVAGFSYGAQLAFEYAYTHSNERIDRLILLSPAYFQDKKSSFVRTQSRYFDHDRAAYVDQFLKNISYPSQTDMSRYLSIGSSDELRSLLSYRWDSERMREILARGTEIDIYLGGKDQIIDSAKAFEFLSPIGTTTLIKDSGHILHAANSHEIDE